MNWIIFLAGTMVGGTIGVFAMALLQANRNPYNEYHQTAF